LVLIATSILAKKKNGFVQGKLIRDCTIIISEAINMLK